MVQTSQTKEPEVIDQYSPRAPTYSGLGSLPFMSLNGRLPSPLFYLTLFCHSESQPCGSWVLKVTGSFADLPGKHWTTPLKSLLSEKNTQWTGSLQRVSVPLAVYNLLEHFLSRFQMWTFHFAPWLNATFSKGFGNGLHTVYWYERLPLRVRLALAGGPGRVPDAAPRFNHCKLIII